MRTYRIVVRIMFGRAVYVVTRGDDHAIGYRYSHAEAVEYRRSIIASDAV